MGAVIRIYPASEFAKLVISIPWAVEGLIPAYGINMIIADPKVGKSILSIQLAHALANKVSFLGYPVLKHWKVLYVQADLVAPEWSHQLSNDPKSSVKLNPLTHGWDTKSVPQGVMTFPAHVEEIKREAKAYDFVILDALVSMFGGQEITSAGTMVRQLAAIRSLFAGPIWLIHHKRKGAAGVPDNSRVAGAGSFALAAGVTGLYDLTANKLRVLGRVVSAELDLRRQPDATWKIETNVHLF